jgi:hypothetical protein
MADIIQTKEVLKEYFQTGDIPTEPQYRNLIESLRHVHDKIPLEGLNLEGYDEEGQKDNHLYVRLGDFLDASNGTKMIIDDTNAEITFKGKIKSEDDIDAIGRNITAGNFIGDGSQLTNIAAALPLNTAYTDTNNNFSTKQRINSTSVEALSLNSTESQTQLNFLHNYSDTMGIISSVVNPFNIYDWNNAAFRYQIDSTGNHYFRGGTAAFEGSIYADGGINATEQTITAGNFIGDGSQLTNIAAALPANTAFTDTDNNFSSVQSFDNDVRIVNNRNFTIYAGNGNTPVLQWDSTLNRLIGRINNDFTFQTLANSDAEGYNWLDHLGNEILRLNRNGNLIIGSNLKLQSGAQKDKTIFLGSSDTPDGKGGIIQGTEVANTTEGYGAWVNYNAYFDGSNWIQPRGNKPSYLYSSNLQLGGFTWRFANAGSTDNGTISLTEVMGLNGSGDLNVSGTGIFGGQHLDLGGNNLTNNPENTLRIYSGQRLINNGNANIHLFSAFSGGASWGQGKIVVSNNGNGDGVLTLQTSLNNVLTEGLVIDENQNVSIPNGNLDVSGAATFYNSVVHSSTSVVKGIFNHQNNVRVLNKVENNYITWATRNVSGSETVIDLSNIGNVDLESVNVTGTATFNGNINASGQTVTALNFTATNGADNVDLHYYGLEFNRALNYVRPSSGTVKDLRIGGASQGDFDWGTVYVYTTGTDDFRWNDNIIATQEYVNSQVGANDTLQEITDNGASTTNLISIATNGFNQLEVRGTQNNQAGGIKLINDVSDELRFDMVSSQFASSDMQRRATIYTSSNVNSIDLGTTSRNTYSLRLNSDGTSEFAGLVSFTAGINASGQTVTASDFLGNWNGLSETDFMRTTGNVTETITGSKTFSQNLTALGFEFDLNGGTITPSLLRNPFSGGLIADTNTAVSSGNDLLSVRSGSVSKFRIQGNGNGWFDGAVTASDFLGNWNGKTESDFMRATGSVVQTVSGAKSFISQATFVGGLITANSTISAGSGSVSAGDFRVANLNTAPSSSTDTGTTGEIRYTADYIYVCTATDTWKRVALSTW